ncbi:MAG: UvrD-helicase domain-containing protein [Holosporales bacterium]|jgi:ATP-dependent helicase/nuclease subunit A|nr:UvrD-helicase domain-containing protein [Holosporales bacterium]
MQQGDYSAEFYEATDIGSSCFVFASAGSGKTKILVDRYIKLLLFGASPENILCVSFTNAAAYEIETRVISILQKLKSNENSYTEKYLKNEIGLKNISETMLNKAKNLFHKFINSFSNITTIHSFCQNLLQNYPLEAEILSNFEIIDEIESKELLEIAKKTFFEKLTDDEQAVKALSQILSNYSFENLLEMFFGSISKVNRFFDMNKDLDQYEQILKKTFNVPNLNMPVVDRTLTSLEPIYLTKLGGKRKKTDNPELQNFVYENKQFRNKIKTIQKTSSFLMIAKEIYSIYQKEKKKRNVLDFADIIHYFKVLLQKDSFSLTNITHYIKHIMLDEAQDMNLDQWNIVSLLSNDIFGHHNNSTIFVVGDIKQSIFGFQDANPRLFIDFHELYKQTLPRIGKNFKTVYLKVCYRLLPEIQKMVDNIFINKFDNYVNHTCFRNNSQGIAKLIPLKQQEDIVEFIKNLDKDPNDIMILTKNRSNISTELMKKLSKEGIPVAGPDRIKLNDSLIIMDVIAVAEFAVNNDNDYALACILKSPYVFEIPLKDEEIFNICSQREDSIYKNLKKNHFYSNHIVFLENLIEIAKTNNIFEFFYYITLQTNIIGNNDINHFLEIVLSRFHKKNESLSCFILWFKNNDITISVNQQKNDGIQISTIHSTKGLESPIVILLDFSLSPDNNKTKFIWTESMSSMNFFVKPNNSESFDEFANLMLFHKASQEEEILNILYVAMTRARDQLYIMGPLTKSNSAYEFIERYKKF